MKLTDAFARVYVINLPFKDDRRHALERNLVETGLADPAEIRWFRATCGDDMPPPADVWHGGNGAWGCWLSHLRIIEEAIADGLDNYLVLEDDAVASPHATDLLGHLIPELPKDWGQLYLGGQHQKIPHDVPGTRHLLRAESVNRTHAFAVNSTAFQKFAQHICYFPHYADEKDARHIDHTLEIEHGRRLHWETYATKWWLFGQEADSSNIDGETHPRRWWHPSRYASRLPFFHVSPELAATPDFLEITRPALHFGNNLKPDTLEDVGLDAADTPQALRRWLAMIAREALDEGKLPALSHPTIAASDIQAVWKPTTYRLDRAQDLTAWLDYPFNNLFPHPINGLPEPESGG